MAEKAELFFRPLDDYEEADDEREEEEEEEYYEEEEEGGQEFSPYHLGSVGRAAPFSDLFVPLALSDISLPDPPNPGPDPPFGFGFGSGSESPASPPPDPSPALGFLDPDWGCDDFFLGRRSSASGSSHEFSRAHAHALDSRGLPLLDSTSDDEQIVAIGALQFDGDGDDNGAPRRDPEFEWEEVDGRLDPDGSRSDGRDMVVEDEEEEGVARNVDWEVLLTVSDLTRNPLAPAEEDAESYSGDEHEEYVYTSEYEVLFGQFIEHESALKGSPPAAKSVVEGLPTVFLTENSAICAVCKDELAAEEGAKRLPCNHHYHAECIVPWLGIRNTCPVCRYELPTDDPEYERRKADRMRRGAANGEEEEEDEESQVRYDFEILA